MSSHVLDLSGQRQMQLTINDPSVTRMWAPARQGDDTEFSFGGREVRIGLHGNVRIQRRKVLVKKQVFEDGRPKKIDGELVYENVPEERLVLVIASSASGFIRSSLTPSERAIPDGTEGKPTYEQHTHTTVTARRRGDDDWHYLEAGDLLEELTFAELLQSPDVAVVSFEEAQRIMAEGDGDPLTAIPARTITNAQAAMNAALTALKALGGDEAATAARKLCFDAREQLAART